MKKAWFILVAFASLLAACSKADETPRLVIFTYDGLRWQELFGGVDSSLMVLPSEVKDNSIVDRYWRPTAEERRQTLLPFTWSYIAEHGYLLGNRWKNCPVEMSNRLWFSYPGYSENFCGYADDERVKSNDAVPNPNTSVLEVANRDPRYAGSVMVYGSWKSIRFAVNNDRGGFPGSTAYEPGLSKNPSETLRLLDEMQEGMPHVWGSERYDAFTYAYAKETLKNDHPKVMYISFGETDEWAHDARYDRYLDAIKMTDTFIKGIVETCENDPFYRGKTTYLITTDHGRGNDVAYRHHGDGSPGSGDTFFIAFGKGIPALGEVENAPLYQNCQVAATIAEILGIEFVPDNGIVREPIRPEQR